MDGTFDMCGRADVTFDVVFTECGDDLFIELDELPWVVDEKGLIRCSDGVVRIGSCPCECITVCGFKRACLPRIGECVPIFAGNPGIFKLAGVGCRCGIFLLPVAQVFTGDQLGGTRCVIVLVEWATIGSFLKG